MSEQDPLTGLPDYQPDTARLKRTGVIVGIAALAVALAGIGWRYHRVAEEGSVAAAAAIPDVAVIHPAQNTGDDDLVLPGQIEAWNSAAINARTNGYVKQWLVDIGTMVHRGQPLAVLDAPDTDQQLAQAEADYQTALANQRLSVITARRWSQLLKEDAVSQQETDEKKGDLDAKTALANASLANVKRLKAVQGFETLYAPFDGLVTSRSAQIGALVVTNNVSSQPLFTVSDIHQMRIYVRVPQRDSALIAPGLTASLHLPEFPNRSFPAVLVRSAGAVDTQSGAVLVELHADNGERLLKPGAYTQVHFHVSAHNGALVLPGSAILYGANGPSVAVVGPDGRVQMRQVRIALDQGSTVEVNGPISPSDQVIDTPPDAVRTGDRVHVVQTEKPATVQPAGGQGQQQAAGGAGHGK